MIDVQFLIAQTAFAGGLAMYQAPPRMNDMSKRSLLLSTFALGLALASCTAGEKVSRLSEGMSTDQVVALMGRPDGFERSGDFTAYRYVNRLVSGWGHDRADYAVIFKDDKVVQYGAGQVRAGQGPNVGYLFVQPMY